MQGLTATTTEFELGAYGVGGYDGEAVGLASGGYFVTWSNTVAAPIAGFSDVSISAIFGRIIGADGTPAGAAFQINQTEPFIQNKPEIIQLSNGNVVVVWEDQTFGDDSVEARGRVYTASGAPVSDEFILSAQSGGEQRIPHIAATPDGGFLAIWQDDRATDTYDDDLYGQYFDASGATVGAEFVALNSYFDVSRTEVLVMEDGAVRIVADNRMWLSDGGVTDVDGTPTLNGYLSNYHNTTFTQNFYSDMAQMTDDRYAIAGVRNAVGTSEAYGVVVQVRDYDNFDNSAVPITSNRFGVLVASDTDGGFPINPQNFVGVDVVGLDSGGLVVVWAQFDSDDTGGGEFNILAQVYDAALNRMGNNVLVHSEAANDQTSPFVTQGADGQILIGWSDDRADTVGQVTIMGRLFTPDVGTPGVISGTEGNDTLIGTLGEDTILGLGGDDTISATEGADQLDTGDGVDLIITAYSEYLRDDTIVGFSATDTIQFNNRYEPFDASNVVISEDGSNRIFTIDIPGDVDEPLVFYLEGDYTGADFSIDLAGYSTVITMSGGPDDLGATPGNDDLTGSEGADTIDGLAGNDRIDGRAGHDLLYGGEGADTILGGWGNDTIIGGETSTDLRDVIYGGEGYDSIDGGYGNDELRGDAGNDNIAGGFGADTVIGGTGDDTLTGSAYGDEIFGGDGMDFINGGFGHDRLNGGADADQFYHLGIFDHGNDWIQDYNAAEGDVLMWGGAAATADNFQVNTADTANAGVAGVAESFVIYQPTGQIIWALVDGDAQAEINIQISGQVFDLLA